MTIERHHIIKVLKQELFSDFITPFQISRHHYLCLESVFFLLLLFFVSWGNNSEPDTFQAPRGSTRPLPLWSKFSTKFITNKMYVKLYWTRIICDKLYLLFLYHVFIWGRGREKLAHGFLPFSTNFFSIVEKEKRLQRVWYSVPLLDSHL